MIESLPSVLFRSLGARPLLLAVAVLCVSGQAYGQFPSPSERIDDLEKRVEELEEELKGIEKDDKKKDKMFSGGVLTLGGSKLRFGGKAEFNFIDSESESFAPLGADGITRNADPHLEVQRLRIVSVLDLNRWISVAGQLDFKPEQGDTRLKELYARHDVQPLWWYASRVQIGLDDRFIRPNRRTRTYPLIGNAFWRDESLALTWRMTFGDSNGRPSEDKKKKKKQKSRRVTGTGPGTEGFDFGESDMGGGDTALDALDFDRNWGEFNVYLSVGQGYALDNNEVGRDGADFNNLVQDNRDLANDLSLRALGGGIEYRRNFRELGEIAVMGFYFDDELRDVSVTFLQQQLTLRDPGGVALAGYGDSGSRKSHRYGASVRYFLPASTLFENILETRRRDGLRLFAQYINGDDGVLERRGWYVQGSYRFSFGRLLLDRYFRSLEPLVRFGKLDVNLDPVPELPGTWGRDRVLLGGILEVTGDVFVKAEYAFNSEKTGDRSVDNDELLIQLLVRF